MRRVTFLAAASTAAQRGGRFAVDEGIEPDATRGASFVGFHGGDASRHGPERRCADTARALGLESTPLPLLRAWDLGSWTGRTITDVAATEPEFFAAWRRDPGAAPHGGEALADLLSRVAAWMEDPFPDGRVVAVADASVVRAAVVHALQPGCRAFWYLDVLPLSLTVLTHGRGEWRVRYVGAPLRTSAMFADDDEA